MSRIETDDEMRELIENTRTIAVVGLSPKEHRPSHSVATYMQSQGYRIIPVNPNATEVLGEKAYSTLSEIPDKIDIVDVFRRSDAVEPIAREAVEIGAGAIWMQLGVINEAAAKIAEDAGIPVVMDRCLAVEHRRLIS